MFCDVLISMRNKKEENLCLIKLINLLLFTNDQMVSLNDRCHIFEQKTVLDVFQFKQKIKTEWNVWRSSKGMLVLQLLFCKEMNPCLRS